MSFILKEAIKRDKERGFSPTYGNTEYDGYEFSIRTACYKNVDQRDSKEKITAKFGDTTTTQKLPTSININNCVMRSFLNLENHIVQLGVR
jgi:hypothetical protein